MRWLTLLLALVAALAGLDLPAHAADPPPWARVSYVSFLTLHPETQFTVAGRLMVPRNAQGKMPAVLIVHAGGGPDSRGPLLAEVLTKAAIATLEIDMWAPRDLAGGSVRRPTRFTETVPDAFGALKFLASHPAVDATRIGITGFSWGGVVSMLTASKPLADRYGLVGLRFGAHVAFYPLCYQYNDARRPEYVFKELTGAPVFIHAAELDTFDAPDSCQTLVDSLPAASRSLVRLKMYPGATHAFDRTEPESVIDSPAASLGKGGKVRLAPDPSAGATAREATAKFFSEVFGLGK